MEIGLWLIILGFLILAYVIFKLIKKVVFAIIAVVLLVVLVFGGVAGLVYIDMKNLADKTDYDVNFLLEEEDDYSLGFGFPVREGEFELLNVYGLSQDDISKIDVDEISKSDNLFIVSINRDFLESLTPDKYPVDSFISPEENKDYNLTFTNGEVLSLMNSKSQISDVIDIVLEKDDVESESLSTKIEEHLLEKDIDVGTAIFSVVLSDIFSDESNSLDLITGYKEGEINIYPDRISFKLIKWLPTKTIQSFLEDNPSNEE